MLTLTSPNQPLIDKIRITNVPVTKIDNPSSLLAKGTLRICSGPGPRISCDDRLLFSSIYIVKDPEFDCYKASICQDGKAHFTLELSVRETDLTQKGKPERHNLNCFTVDTLWVQLRRAQRSLQNQYGVHIDISNPTFSYIEINRTFPIRGPFFDYRRPLTYIASLPSAILRLRETDDYDRDHALQHPQDQLRAVQSYRKSSSNRGLEMKIYDKTAHLKSKGFDVDRTYVRVELILKSTTRIQRSALKSTCLKSLTNEQLVRFFNDFVERQLVNQHSTKQADLRAFLRRTLLESYATERRGWAEQTLMQIHDLEEQNQVPLILSIEALTSLVDVGNERYLRRLIRARAKGHRLSGSLQPHDITDATLRQVRHRIKSRLTNVCMHYYPIYMQGDQRRMEEIFTQLLPSWQSLPSKDKPAVTK